MPGANRRQLATLILVTWASVAPVESGAETPIFSDGFELGSVCLWSGAKPHPQCQAYQTCEQAAGDYWGCFELPYLAAPEPLEIGGAGDPVVVTRADVYVLVDRSGSMSVELTAIKNNLASAVAGARCPPEGSGTPGACYPDLWSGAGTIGYAGASGASYSHHVDVQPNASFAGLPTTEPSGCCNETTLLAIWAAVTGQGSATSGCTIGTSFAARTTCAGSPAANAGAGGRGYPCFRDDALPLVMVATDEAPITGAETYHCPASSTVIAETVAVGGKLIGIVGSSPASGTDEDLAALALGTGAVDDVSAPLVVSGAGTNSAAAIAAALQMARTSMPLEDVHAVVVDGLGDAVDVTAFVDRIETAPDIDPGTCAQSLGQSDRDLDGFDDTYDVVPGSAVVCWRIVATTNVDVPGSEVAQNFPGTLRIFTGAAVLQEKPVLFLVPPG